MKQNVLIVGKSGSLGDRIWKHLLESPEQYNVFATSSNKEAISESTFFVDLNSASTFSNIPDLRIDHLIIAAGYEPNSNLAESSEAHIEKMFRLHIIGPMLLIKHLQQKLTEHSSIILFSSPAAWQGSYDPSYASVKGAVNSLVRTLAKDLAPYTRVNALSPSLIEASTVYHKMTDDFKQRHIERTLNKKLLTLDECIDAISFMLNASHYTGQILHLNGGMIYGS